MRSWVNTWMTIAKVMKQRSKCVNAQVGAVIVGSDERIVATGYNGPPAGYSRDDQMRCSEFCDRPTSSNPCPMYSDCTSVHAEINAIAYADRSRMEGGTIYVTNTPCWSCAKVIANSGIKHIVFEKDKERDFERTRFLLEKCGIRVTEYVGS